MESDRGSLSILVVEDETLLAMLAEEMLTELGHLPVVVSSCAAAKQRIAEQFFDAAILDIGLRGETSEQAAVALRDLNVPLAFATGYGSTPFTAFDNAKILPKPYTMKALGDVIAQLCPSETGN